MPLTIIIPTIGRPTLERAIESVENQTIRTKYLVVEDVGGIGAGPTRNKALSSVKTAWVGFLDDDDYLDPHYHEWLQKEKDGYDLVIFRMQNSPIKDEAIPREIDPDKLIYNGVGISFAIKTKLAALFPFKNMIGEDYDMITRIRNAGYRVKISQHVGYYIGDLKP